MLFRDIKRNINIEFVIMLYFKEGLMNFVFRNKVVDLESFRFNVKIFKEFVSIDSLVFVMKI